VEALDYDENVGEVRSGSSCAAEEGSYWGVERLDRRRCRATDRHGWADFGDMSRPLSACALSALLCLRTGSTRCRWPQAGRYVGDWVFEAPRSLRMFCYVLLWCRRWRLVRCCGRAQQITRLNAVPASQCSTQRCDRSEARGDDTFVRKKKNYNVSQLSPILRSRHSLTNVGVSLV